MFDKDFLSPKDEYDYYNRYEHDDYDFYNSDEYIEYLKRETDKYEKEKYKRDKEIFLKDIEKAFNKLEIDRKKEINIRRNKEYPILLSSKKILKEKKEDKKGNCKQEGMLESLKRLLT